MMPPHPKKVPHFLFLMKERGLALGIMGLAQWQKAQALLCPQLAM